MILEELMKLWKQQERVVDNLNLFQTYVSNEIQGLKAKLNAVEQNTQNLSYLFINKSRVPDEF